MKKVIRRVYSSDFAEAPMEQTQRPRRKRRLLKAVGAVAGTAAVAGAGGYYARNTKAGKAVRKFASENGGDFIKRKAGNVKSAGKKLYGDYLTKDGRSYKKKLKQMSQGN